MLIILGSGGWLPAYDRHTATALLRDGDTAVVIDAGTGVARLVEQPEMLDGVRRLDIVLTHFHLDHIAGLAYLPALGLCETTTIWGPGRLLYDLSTEEMLGRIYHEPFHPVSLDRLDVTVADIPGHEFELSGWHVTSRRQDRHSAPSLGLRFNDELAWITDTAYDPASAPFAAGCRLLAHEAWFPAAAPRNADVHCSAQDAARVALDAQIERLLLIHLPPFQASTEEIAAEATATVPGALEARDGLYVEV